MQVTDYLADDLLIGRLVEDADGHITYIDMEDGAEFEVKTITHFEDRTLITTWNGYAYTLWG